MGITEWLSANLATLIVAALLALIMILLVRSKIRERRNGGCGCGCGCQGCSGRCEHAASSNRTEENR